MMKKEVQMTDEERLKIFSDPDILTSAIQKATKEAVQAHRLAGHKVCAWKNGQVIWYGPDEIPE